jgi:hypothetical protein
MADKMVDTQDRRIAAIISINPPLFFLIGLDFDVGGGSRCRPIPRKGAERAEGPAFLLRRTSKISPDIALDK